MASYSPTAENQTGPGLVLPQISEYPFQSWCSDKRPSTQTKGQDKFTHKLTKKGISNPESAIMRIANILDLSLSHRSLFTTTLLQPLLSLTIDFQLLCPPTLLANMIPRPFAQLIPKSFTGHTKEKACFLEIMS